MALPHHLQLHRGLPCEIRITEAIGEVKKAILKGSRSIPSPKPPSPTGDSATDGHAQDWPCGDDAAGPSLLDHVAFR